MASVLGGGSTGRHLVDRLAEVSEQVLAAIRADDGREQAIARLERALVEQQLSDLYGPWSREGDRYAAWMRDDLKIAREWAESVGAAGGVSDCVERLMRPYPTLRNVVLW